MFRVPLGFGDLSVDVPSHLCLFYYDDVELRSKLGFLRLGLETENEAVVLFGVESRLRQVLDYLVADHGVDVAAHLAAGRISLVTGAADADGLLANIAARLDALRAEGIGLIRFLGFIGWADDGWPTHDDLLDFESRVTEAAAGYPAVVMCTYRLTDIPGPLLIYGGIETHPLTIIGGTVCENPHFVPREQFMRTQAERTAWLQDGRDRFEGVRISRGHPSDE
jgi:hypothetical protein